MPSRLYATLIRAAKISILSLSSKLLASFLQNFAKKGAPVIREAIANEIIPQDFYILTLSFQDRRPASGQPLYFSLALSRIRTAVSDFKSLAKVVRNPQFAFILPQNCTKI